MKVRLTIHAHEQCEERGAIQEEVEEAVRKGVREKAKRGRWLYRYNFAYNATWQGKLYSIKQVAPVVAEGHNEFVVITVYTFFF